MRSSQNQSISGHLHRLWGHIGPRRRRQFSLLVLLMVAATFAEIVSIGAVLPFLGVLTAPEQLFHHPQIQPLVQWLGLAEPRQLLAPLTISFGLAALLAGAMRLLLLWASTRLAFATGADLSIEIYRRTLHQPYAVHVSRNSSEVINGIVGKVQTVIYNAINPVVSMIAGAIMLTVILLALLALDPVIALAAFSGFGAIYAVIIRASRSRLKANAQRIADHSTLLIKSLQEGLGGIRDVLIDGSQDAYCQVYRESDLQLRRAQGSNQFVSQSPRYVMEALGMALIAILAFVMARQPNGIGKAIPVLGALALGAQRLLPVLQQLYSGWSNIQGSQKSLQDALDLLEQPLPPGAGLPPPSPLPFRHAISLDQLSFRYSPATPWVLQGVQLTMPKGSRIGFVGSTGSGKSTLLDIVMGLLAPTEGQLRVDDTVVDAANHRGWQAHIAHVPQTIFLSDASIEENIAFGVPREAIDPQRVRCAARQAQIADTIESWEQQYQTMVGERGVRLSGGQRQRIGIARALYKQADVVILDEATSALDNDTESSVMQAIESLGQELTILIIAHRLTTLKNCTHIVELSAGTVSRVGTYWELIEKPGWVDPQAQPAAR